MYEEKVTYDTRYLPGSRKGELNPENKLRVIFFFDPELYDHFLEAGYFSLLYLKEEETRKYMVPWDGYGSLEEKYPPANIY